MPGGATFIDRLSGLGYDTCGIGKCHFTPDPDALKGFRVRFSQEELPRTREGDSYATWLRENGFSWVVEPHGVRSEMYYVPQPSPLPATAHPTQWIGDRTIDYIRDGNRRPWFLQCNFIHPHPPFSPPIPWHKLYRATDMALPKLPPDPERLLCHINHEQNRFKYRDRGLDLHLVRCQRAYYYACISFVDYQIGRILEALRESGDEDNTVVVFTSDHGEYLGDYGCFGKRGFHDVSARIPFMVRWPGRAPARCGAPVSLIDLGPTFVRLAGGGSLDNADGVDLEPLTRGIADRQAVYSQFRQRGHAVFMRVDDRWKYAYSAPDGREYLFDHLSDPDEMWNLADDPDARCELGRCRSECIGWAVTQGQQASVNADGTWTSYPRLCMDENPDTGLIRQDPVWWDPGDHASMAGQAGYFRR